MDNNMSAIIIAKDTEFANKVIDVLRTVYDPEIPVDIWELGLIYEVDVNDDKDVSIKMTLTSPSCPAAESMPSEVETKVSELEGAKSSKVEVVFDPTWTQDMMSDVARLELGFM
jgi:FeS assembly SUF system protein